LSFFDKVKSEFRKKVVFLFSYFDYNDEKFIKDEILEKGFSIIFSTFHCELVDINDTKLARFHSKKVSTFFRKFIEDQFISQIMISNNINFRIQLKNYGGFGYANLFRNYYEEIIRDLNENYIYQIFRKNLIDLLTWWQPPIKSAIKVHYITCSRYILLS
jgi:hypothetical protein